jgi:hypothetical protein
MCYTPGIFNNIFRWQFFLERDISMWAQAYNNNTLLLAAIRYNKMNCELMLTYDTPAYMFNVYKNQPSRQTGSRNLMGSKMLTTIWGADMKLVTKYQICVINSC